MERVGERYVHSRPFREERTRCQWSYCAPPQKNCLKSTLLSAILVSFSASTDITNMPILFVFLSTGHAGVVKLPRCPTTIITVGKSTASITFHVQTNFVGENPDPRDAAFLRQWTRILAVKTSSSKQVCAISCCQCCTAIKRTLSKAPPHAMP